MNQKPNIFERLGAAVRSWNYTLADMDKDMDAVIVGQQVYSGVNVNPDTAMKFSAFFTAVMQISQAIASLNLVLYKTNGDKPKIVEKAHPLFKVFKKRVSLRMSYFRWAETSQVHRFLWGNSYSYIIRDRGNRVTGLVMMNPARMKPFWNGTDIVYIFKKPDGQEITYPRNVILHIPALGTDGVRGLSIIELARESIGLGIAQNQFEARFIGRGTHLGGIIKSPKKLTKEAKDNLKASWREAYSGLGNMGGIPVLEEGLEYEKTMMPLSDAQFLANKTFTIQDIARWFNIPPDKLKELSRATYSNIEYQQLSWLTDTIRPWLERIEAEYDFQLLNEKEQDAYICEHNFKSILRPTVKERAEANHIMWQDGVISEDEWRADEGMNPTNDRAGADRFIPLNMQPASMVYEPKAPATVFGVPPEPSAKPTPVAPVPTTPARAAIDERTAKQETKRKKIARQFQPVFSETVRPLVEKERKDIMEIARSAFGQRGKRDFGKAINKYYGQFATDFRQKWHPVFDVYARAIAPIAAGEVGKEHQTTTGFENEIKSFTDNTTTRYIESSKGQLLALVNENKGKEIDAIDQRTQEWMDTRPDKVGLRESVDGECGIAQFIFFGLGFRTVWDAHATACPICKEMDGRTVSQGEFFVKQGDTIAAEGAEPLLVTKNFAHPGLHGGCECSVRAEIK